MPSALEGALNSTGQRNYAQSMYMVNYNAECVLPDSETSDATRCVNLVYPQSQTFRVPPIMATSAILPSGSSQHPLLDSGQTESQPWRSVKNSADHLQGVYSSSFERVPSFGSSGRSSSGSSGSVNHFRAVGLADRLDSPVSNRVRKCKDGVERDKNKPSSPGTIVVAVGL